jgi:hypothetical protein
MLCSQLRHSDKKRLIALRFRDERFQSLCTAALSDWLRIVPGDSGIQMLGL